LNANSVNVRATACGTVIGSSSSGSCYVSRGGKVGCTLSGTLYQFFEIQYGNSVGWVAGIYLNIGTSSQCGGGGPGTEPTTEFRSLFLTTAFNVDWPNNPSNTVASQQQQMIDYLNHMSNTNMNAVVFQVRPAGDTIYFSTIEPWSRFLTGTQGTPPNPQWDPLQYIITEAHNRGIEVHAWLNPYRANTAGNWNGLASNHMANVYRQYAYPYNNLLWMDPGAQVVVDHLVRVIDDIVRRYNVDGIHFDDYFYPYSDGTQFPDTATYNAYYNAGGRLSRDDWRRDNVNRMVQRVYNTVKSIKPQVKFSISPFGLYRPGNAQGMPSPITGLDPYSTMYADSKYWLAQGWVDFFAPQLYWAIAPPQQSYPAVLDWWLNNNPLGRHIYAANGVYKMSDSNNWPVSEIENQIWISREQPRRDKRSLGNIMYSAKFFRDNTKGIRDAFRTRVYTTKAVTPAMTWLASPPQPPTNVRVDNEVISWEQTAQEIKWWSVMRRDPTTNTWQQYEILPPHSTSLKVEPGDYCVCTVNGASVRSEAIYIHVSSPHDLPFLG